MGTDYVVAVALDVVEGDGAVHGRHHQLLVFGHEHGVGDSRVHILEALYGHFEENKNHQWRLDTQDGRGCACALGRGPPHQKPADPS